MMFIDLEKVYNRVPMEVLWRWMEKKGVSISCIRVTREIYTRLRIRVRTETEITSL